MRAGWRSSTFVRPVFVIVAGQYAGVGARFDQIFDLILMDIQMPEMDGLDATRAIRVWEKSTDRYTPIVMLTAHVLNADRELSLKAGADGHVAKPIHMAELFEAIRVAILAGHNPPGAGSRSLLTH